MDRHCGRVKNESEEESTGGRAVIWLSGSMCPEVVWVCGEIGRGTYGEDDDL